MAEGDAAAAVDLLVETLERVPAWAPGWFALGEAREAIGDRDGAAAAYRRALDVDPDDSLGARLRLGLLGATDVPSVPPSAFIRDLFDDYAPRFESSLVDGLSYRGPQLIASALDAAAPGRSFARAIDLGCGTGLMAETIRSRVGHVIGVDLSARMIAAARAKGLYDGLVVGDVVEVLAGEGAGSVDLVTAADVFCYLGDLQPVVAASSRVLAPGGLLAFTVEVQIDAAANSGFSLKDSLRYCHRQDYVFDVGRRSGLDLVSLAREEFRMDRGVPVEGFIVLFGRL